MDWLIEAVRDFCYQQGFDKTYWIGYSGGLDSHVLLHLLTRLRSEYPLKLHAVYINHGLSPNATTWAKHCAQICEQWQVDFSEHFLSCQSSSPKNLEETAREGRYAIFQKLLAPHDILFTAHHQNDQAETVLLQLLRGAGPKGLAAMPMTKIFTPGIHARPLLHVSRDELKDYAEKHHLHWIEDESNSNTYFTRNFIRHDVMPILENRWPSSAKTLSRVAENCAEAQLILDEIAQQDLASVLARESMQLVSVTQLLQLTPARQRNVLRAWLLQLNFPIPPAIKLRQIQHDMLHAREDKSPHFTWDNVELRRYRHYLYAMPCLSQHTAKTVLTWNLSQSLLLPNIGTLQATYVTQPAANQCLHSTIKNVSVRFRCGGEKFQLPGRNNHHELKKLFQEWNIPPWQRERVPLIFVENTLAAIVGFGVSDEFAARGEGYLLTLCPSP